MTFSAREETIWLLDNELLMEIDTNSKRTRKTRHFEVQGDTGRNIFQIDLRCFGTFSNLSHPIELFIVQNMNQCSASHFQCDEIFII